MYRKFIVNNYEIEIFTTKKTKSPKIELPLTTMFAEIFAQYELYNYQDIY